MTHADSKLLKTEATLAIVHQMEEHISDKRMDSIRRIAWMRTRTNVLKKRREKVAGAHTASVELSVAL